MKSIWADCVCTPYLINYSFPYRFLFSSPRRNTDFIHSDGLGLIDIFNASFLDTYHSSPTIIIFLSPVLTCSLSLQSYCSTWFSDRNPTSLFALLSLIEIEKKMLLLNILQNHIRFSISEIIIFPVAQKCTTNAFNAQIPWNNICMSTKE